MDNYQTIRIAIEDVMKIMAENGYSPVTINSQRCILNGLIQFLQKNSYANLNEDTALAFIKERTGFEVIGFWGRDNRKINRIMKPVQNLLRYLRSTR